MWLREFIRLLSKFQTALWPCAQQVDLAAWQAERAERTSRLVPRSFRLQRLQARANQISSAFAYVNYPRETLLISVYRIPTAGIV